MAPLTMMDFTNQEWGLVMLTSCPRCQLTFRTNSCTDCVPCAGSCSPSYADPTAHPPLTNRLPSIYGGPFLCTASVHTPSGNSVEGCRSTRNPLVSQGCCSVVPRSPDPSTAHPLSFVLPCPPINPKTRVPPLAFHTNNGSNVDLERLSVTLRCLHTSGWFYEGLSWSEAITLLESSSPGTFLVRESSNPGYLFSMSLQSDKGPTSVRIQYIQGYFRLDADPSVLPVVPLFDCIVKMIEYYIASSQAPKSNRDLVFLDRTGSKYSSILIKKPLLRRAPSLQHLARLKINEVIQNGETVPNMSVLPLSLRTYLKEYPYTH